MGQRVSFNRRNGAATALAAVGSELDKLVLQDKALRSWLSAWLDNKVLFEDAAKGDTSTFICRNIQGSQRLSNHSFGSAIDLYNPHMKEPQYWLWEEAERRARKSPQKQTSAEILKTLKEKGIPDYRPEAMAAIPQSLIDAFERHGFIWGGKWNHFDTMHFEYRPEFFEDLKFDCSLE